MWSRLITQSVSEEIVTKQQSRKKIEVLLISLQATDLPLIPQLLYTIETMFLGEMINDKYKYNHTTG